MEYTKVKSKDNVKDGYATYFTITTFEPFKKYEFDMENENIKGHWSGVFSVKNNKVCIEFTENVTAKKFFLKPFVNMYLKKQQKIYVNDLKRAVEG